MSRSEAEIRQYHKQSHDELTRAYYQDPGAFPGGKEAFDWQHGVIWAALDHELLQAGYLEPPGPTIEERLAAIEAKIGSLDLK